MNLKPLPESENSFFENLELINIHSHIGIQKENSICIVNHLANFSNIPPCEYVSLGIHPCAISAHGVSENFSKLCKAADAPNVLAIGECGLDKLCSVDLELQKIWFTAQLELGISLKKPIVIHCVRAFSEILEILEKKSLSAPLIFHGFNRNLCLANQLLSKGYFLSMGAGLKHKNIQEICKKIPAERLFLETDSAEVSIEEIYRLAALARETSLHALSKQIKQNFQQVFGTHI